MRTVGSVNIVVVLLVLFLIFVMNRTLGIIAFLIFVAILAVSR